MSGSCMTVDTTDLELGDEDPSKARGEPLTNLSGSCSRVIAPPSQIVGLLIAHPNQRSWIFLHIAAAPANRFRPASNWGSLNPNNY